MSGIEKTITVFAAGLIAIAVGYTLTAKTAKTPQVVTSIGKATSSSLSAAEGKG